MFAMLPYVDVIEDHPATDRYSVAPHIFNQNRIHVSHSADHALLCSAIIRAITTIRSLRARVRSLALTARLWISGWPPLGLAKCMHYKYIYYG